MHACFVQVAYSAVPKDGQRVSYITLNEPAMVSVKTKLFSGTEWLSLNLRFELTVGWDNHDIHLM